MRRLHYFLKIAADNTSLQVQESQESFGGEHDHPAEINQGEIKTHETFEAARLAAIDCANAAKFSPESGTWEITIETKDPRLTATTTTFGEAHEPMTAETPDADLSAWAADRRAAWTYYRAKGAEGIAAGYPFQAGGVWTVKTI